MVPADGPSAACELLQRQFLAILPRIELHARIYFRHVACSQKKADAVAETVALSWQWFVRLAQRGKDATQFPSALARFATRAVNSGRRLCGQERNQDLLSPLAQYRHHFVVETLPQSDTSSNYSLAEALCDNTHTPIPEQVAFRFDFPAWRRTRTDRDRRLMEDLMIGERTRDVSHRYGLSPTRVSQLRREFHDDWARFCSDATEDLEVLA